MPRRPGKSPAELTRLKRKIAAKQAGGASQSIAQVKREIANGIQRLKADAVIEDMAHQQSLRTIEDRLRQGEATATDLTNLKRFLKIYFR
mgnify:CR=1 FL=1